MITQERLKELLHYDPETGAWTRLRGIRGYGPGSKVGCVNKSNGYLYITVDGISYLAHRLAWLYIVGRWPENQIDHINCDRSDNRFKNLRDATSSQNKGNLRKPAHNSSGFKGVSFNKNAGKFSASIHINDKKKHLGYFRSATEAHARYIEESASVFGEYARSE